LWGEGWPCQFGGSRGGGRRVPCCRGGGWTTGDSHLKTREALFWGTPKGRGPGIHLRVSLANYPLCGEEEKKKPSFLASKTFAKGGLVREMGDGSVRRSPVNPGGLEGEAFGRGGTPVGGTQKIAQKLTILPGNIKSLTAPQGIGTSQRGKKKKNRGWEFLKGGGMLGVPTWSAQVGGTLSRRWRGGEKHEEGWVWGQNSPACPIGPQEWPPNGRKGEVTLNGAGKAGLIRKPPSKSGGKKKSRPPNPHTGEVSAWALTKKKANGPEKSKHQGKNRKNQR